MRLEVNHALRMVLCYAGTQLILSVSFGDMRALGLNIGSDGRPFATWEG